MMISAAKGNRRGTPGFSVLELVVVLAITMMMIGGALAALYFSRDEARLEGGVVEIEAMAKRARTLATLDQRPYALEFTPGGVRVMSYSETLLDDGERDRIREALEQRRQDQSPDVEAVAGSHREDRWVADQDMRIAVLRWAASDWVELQKRDRQIWRFDPNGICEPVAVRLAVEDSWISVRFNPLTAAVAETESEIR